MSLKYNGNNIPVPKDCAKTQHRKKTIYGMISYETTLFVFKGKRQSIILLRIFTVMQQNW